MNLAVMDDTGKLVLRLVLGLLIIQHGIAKILGGIAWLGPVLAAHHLPGFVAYGVYVGEVIAPILIIIGLYTRIGGVLIVINMLFAFWLVHLPHLFTLDNGHWAFGLQGIFLFSGVAVALMGSGRFAARPD